jgi:FlaA1/EpsC-like NDP-sugar epimerase
MRKAAARSTSAHVLAQETTTVLVTGASGVIGSALLPRLHSDRVICQTRCRTVTCRG